MTEQIQKKSLSQPDPRSLDTVHAFLIRNELLIPVSLFVLFLTVALPGISWGAPAGWHPDEIVIRALKAIAGEWQFSEINFDYPDLPQYTMYWLGKAMIALGYGYTEVMIASRLLSALLAGLTIVLTYVITRKITNNIYVAGLSGLLLVCASEMAHNAHFAHNDTYITFFATLTLLFLVNYRLVGQRIWLYASFISVGMAASSKYNGISLLLIPLGFYLFTHRYGILKRPLRVLETLFIGGALTFLGFAIGTPKALFWMTYYFKRMIPALLHTGNYARQPDSVRGIFGQYASLADGLGIPLFTLFSIAFLWALYKLVRAWSRKPAQHDPRTGLSTMIAASIVALDLPIMISYNFPTRFFLSMLPALAILSALFVEDIHEWTIQTGKPQIQKLGFAALSILAMVSFARNISVMLLFMNDARIPASEFVKTLPAGTSLEHTYYPPTLPTYHFEREHNYPIYFIKDKNETLPTSKKFVYNAGEIGLLDRQTDYFVVDSFTTDKFDSDYTCASMQVECEFFKQLATGKSDHYQLIAEFSYSLPSPLPQMDLTFVNPTIHIYERIP